MACSKTWSNALSPAHILVCARISSPVSGSLADSGQYTVNVSKMLQLNSENLPSTSPQSDRQAVGRMSEGNQWPLHGLGGRGNRYFIHRSQWCYHFGCMFASYERFWEVWSIRCIRKMIYPGTVILLTDWQLNMDFILRIIKA